MVVDTQVFRMEGHIATTTSIHGVACDDINATTHITSHSCA